MEDVQQHLSQGVSVDAVDVEGRTALFFAAANGHLEIVELLLEKEADPDIANAQGNTALHWACARGESGTVAWLSTEAGSDPNAVNSEGATPLHAAACHVGRALCLLRLWRSEVEAREGVGQYLLLKG